MARKKRDAGADPSAVESSDYRHDREKRLNIPPAKIAAEGRVPSVEKARYAYDPHLPPTLRFDPAGEEDRLYELVATAGSRTLEVRERDELVSGLVQHAPWLEWAGRMEERERGFFEVDPVALHIHERISAQAVIRVATRRDPQRELFADPQQPYAEAVQFYQHDVDWANRLILGDSLQVMSSLAHREGLAGKVQTIYMDPPYGVHFSSNFQPELRRRNLQDRDRDLTREPEMVKAYRDTWTLGVHSYLSYLRSRLILAREMLHDSGSIFVQIGDENVHRVRGILDEVFGSRNFVAQIVMKTTSGAASPTGRTTTLPHVHDYILWYARRLDDLKYRQLFVSKASGKTEGELYQLIRLADGYIRRTTRKERDGSKEVPNGARRFRPDDLTSRSSPESARFLISTHGMEMGPGKRPWTTNEDGIRRLNGVGRIWVTKNATARYMRFLDDSPVMPLNNVWTDVGTGSFTEDKVFSVQTNTKVIQRCILMTTDPGDLVLDPTCGSGTTAYVAEEWGRRWITIDTSRVAITLARQRLLTATFKHWRTLSEAKDGHANPAKGFALKTVPHVQLKNIVRNEHLDPILHRHDAILDVLLGRCNEALTRVPQTLRDRLGAKLHAKEKEKGTGSVTDRDRRRWLLPPTNREYSAKQRKALVVAEDFEGWYYWEVPFDADPDWPKDLAEAVESYREAWQEKMAEVGECIAANSEGERLVDQPEVLPGVLRVSGPFTVEGVRPEELSLGEDGLFDPTPNTFQESAPDDEASAAEVTLRNQTAYLDRMVRLLAEDGVTFPNNQHRGFEAVEPLYESGGSGGTLLHAEGKWQGTEDSEPNNVAIGFGPQYGPVTAEQVEDLVRASRRYNELVIAGFAFDAAASAVIQESSHPKLRIHQAYVRPDVNPGMDGLLKETANSQLFSVFGQPDLVVRRDGNDDWVCELKGVDVYDPISSEIRSTGAAKVAAWFLDQDYDGRCFCTTQAFFPDQGAWKKIAKALGSSADPDAFKALDGTESIPFPAGKHRRLAVKVIDPRGNEVMAVRPLEG